MNSRTATRYLFWVGEKIDAGDELTDKDTEMMKEAKEASLDLVRKFMRLGPKDWKYTKGEPFK
jgi:hypothetical protein